MAGSTLLWLEQHRLSVATFGQEVPLGDARRNCGSRVVPVGYAGVMWSLTRRLGLAAIRSRSVYVSCCCASALACAGGDEGREDGVDPGTADPSVSSDPSASPSLGTGSTPVAPPTASGPAPSSPATAPEEPSGAMPPVMPSAMPTAAADDMPTSQPAMSGNPPGGVEPDAGVGGGPEPGNPEDPEVPDMTVSPVPEPDAADDGGARSGIVVQGRQILVDGVALHIQGVCWNPVPAGGTHPDGLDYAGYADQDIALMQAAGVNAVRTYEPLTDTVVLDKLYAAGIHVLSTVYPYGGNDVGTVRANVEPVKDHPAILMWVLGNEWNYNGLYVDLPHDETLQRINDAAAQVRMVDTSHPIMTIYGGVPAQSVIDAMPEIDVWGVNYYGGLSFGESFSQWAARSGKPMVITEYGADAYNSNSGMYDPDAQAEATRVLTQLIADNASADNPEAVCAGGTIFEWADEWWKDGDGAVDVQDPGGIAPGGGPHPDQTFNEEWWGIVDIERNPRPAYAALQEVFAARE